MDVLTTKPEQRQQHQNGRQRGRQRPAQGLGGRDVDDLDQVRVAHCPDVLANTVKDHNGVVQRVTDHRQQGCQHGQIEGQTKEGKEPQGENHVMHQSQNGRYRKLHLKAQGHVQQDAADGQQHAQAALIAQLLTNLRPDKLDSLDDDLAAFGAFDHVCHLITQVRVIARQTDQHIGGGAEVLHDRIVPAVFTQGQTNLFQISGFAVVELNQRTAGEVQPQIQLLDDQTAQRGNHQHNGYGKEEFAQTEEIDGSIDVHYVFLRATASSRRDRQRPG